MIGVLLRIGTTLLRPADDPSPVGVDHVRRHSGHLHREEIPQREGGNGLIEGDRHTPHPFARRRLVDPERKVTHAEPGMAVLLHIEGWPARPPNEVLEELLARHARVAREHVAEDR